MVHHEFYALAAGVLVERLDVEVRVRGDEVEHIVLAAVGPVLPAYVPAFHEQGVEAVGGREVYVAAHIGVVGAVASVRRGCGVVETVELDGRHVGVGPASLAGYHLPPYAHVLDRLDPVDIFVGARLVEVEHKAAGELFLGRVGHLDRPPRGGARRLHVALPSLRVRGEEGAERAGLAVYEQMHARIVYQGGFVDVDIQSVVRLHLQGGLYSGGAEKRL